jgi:hypothetical protein
MPSTMGSRPVRADEMAACAPSTATPVTTAAICSRRPPALMRRSEAVTAGSCAGWSKMVASVPPAVAPQF